MSDLLAELAAACHGSPRPRDDEKLRAGESVWLAGRPAPADDGYIGLEMGEGHTVFVSESAVQEVEKDDRRYFVRVAAGTPALVRSEAVTTLRDVPPSGCGCSEHATGAVARAPGGGGGGGTGPIIIQCPLVCRVEPQCSLVLTGTGRVIRLCVPILVCRRECPSQPA